MKGDLDKYVFNCLKDHHWWTFWELQELIQQMTGKFYGETSISAAIRNLRKFKQRQRFDLPLDLDTEVIEKKKRDSGKGYQYRLIKQ